MQLRPYLRSTFAALALLAAIQGLRAAEAPLFVPTVENIATLETEKDPRLSLDTSTGAPLLRVEFPGGDDYPGFNFPVPAAGLNLAAFAGIEVELVNLGPARLNLNLRVDNPGDWRKSPWNTENLWIATGETKTLKLTFGRSFGRPGFALDGAKVSAIKLFAAQPKETSSVLIKAIRPFGVASAVVVAPAAPTNQTSTPVAAPAAAAKPVVAAGPIFTPTAENIPNLKTEKDPVLSLDASGAAPALKIAFPNGGDYPGLDLPLAGGLLNLSGYAGIQAEIVNLGASRLNVNLRADNPGDWRKNPWNTNNVWIAAGETKTVRVVFGQSYGRPGYALDPAKISNVKLFVEQPKPDAAILVRNVAPYGAGAPAPAASAQPAAAPAPAPAAGQDSTYSPSIGGELLDLAKPDALAGFTHADSSATLVDGKIKVVFNGGANYPNIQFPVPRGGWNLSAFDRIEVEITNPGTKAISPLLRADNPGHWKDQPWNTQRQTIPPGETRTLRLVFGQDNGAPGFALNPARVIGIQLFLERPKADATLIISSVKATGSPADAANRLSFTKPEDRNVPAFPPAWLGQRPPVEGEWVKTLDENFDGFALNTDRWNTRFPWDGPQPGQLQRYSPDNIEVDDGILVLTAEKKFGHENNDPKLGTRDYTSGLVTTYDKWSQLYGYYEARIKIPYTRGLWPAFWMMPDRGPASGLSQWQRRDTGKGAMEIDIMEILSEWGPGRNSVAVHWDGYGAEHKQWGTSQIYYGPTPDGWHAFGLLWEPGKLTWYVDGKKTAELANERVSNVASYLKFNIQIGGWATKDVDDANLPASMQVDYVRAWQLRERR